MLTGARYGALLTFDLAGQVRDFYTSGLSEEQRETISRSPQGLGLLGYLNTVQCPVRLKDMAAHPESVGLPQGHPEMKTFLGMPIYHRDQHVGNIYLTEKVDGQEFTQEDEDMAALFAAQAASIISHARRYEAEHRAKVDLETLMDVCPVAVALFDARQGEIAFMNREAQRLAGSIAPSPEDLENIFQNLRYSRPDGRELSFVELPGTRALQSSEPVIAEEIIIHLPDGTRFNTLVSCAPIFSPSGELVSVLSVMQDLTPLEHQALNRTEFLGLVSEELRTPLAAIKGSATALMGLLDDLHPTEAGQLLRIIDQQSDLMRTQINSLTELTQIDTGTLSLTSEPVEVANLIEWSCAEYLREHSAVTIQLNVDQGLSKVLADKQRINTVLHNFLREALSHSDESSPVTVSATTIDIYVAISVAIKGPYLHPERAEYPAGEAVVPQVYRNATRAHAKSVELTSKGDSLAMGYCRGVVEAHGGRMRSVVDEEKGTLTITFTLPEAEDVVEPTPLDIPESEPRRTPVLSGRNSILVSIQEPRLLGSVRTTLLNADYNPTSSYDLHQVEEIAASEKVDLLLVDISGREEECFRVIQRIWDSLQLPVIALCDRQTEDFVVRAFEMGAEGYVVKPFSSSELTARIKASLRKYAGAREVAPANAFRLGDVRVNFDERTVTVAGHPVQLTATEYKLLTELANCAGRVLTQDELLQRVWGPEYAGEPQLLRSYVKSLRQKLGDNARKPTYIFTEHGIGYRMAKTVNGGFASSGTRSSLYGTPAGNNPPPSKLAMNARLPRLDGLARRDASLR